MTQTDSRNGDDGLDDDDDQDELDVAAHRRRAVSAQRGERVFQRYPAGGSRRCRT